MEIQNDFKELPELFNAHKVDYIIVGGYALAFHGAPRFTGDIDLLVKAAAQNAQGPKVAAQTLQQHPTVMKRHNA